MVMDLIDSQLTDVQRRHPNAVMEQSPDGNRLLVVPDVRAGAGWTKEFVTVRVLVPTGFPHVKPDCFYTEADLRLSSGVDPSASTIQSVFGGQYRWFSWHLLAWDATSGTLGQYVHFCRRRLQDAR